LTRPADLCLGKVHVEITLIRKASHMVSKRKIPFAPRSPFLVPGAALGVPDQAKVLGPNNDGSLRMGDEGCPNESLSVDDATGYSKAEEEEEANSTNCDEAL
jgi:hypothetical protein